MYPAQQSQINTGQTREVNLTDSGAGGRFWNTQTQMHRQAHSLEKPVVNSGTRHKAGQQEVQDTGKKEGKESSPSIPKARAPAAPAVPAFVLLLHVSDVSAKQDAIPSVV